MTTIIRATAVAAIAATSWIALSACSPTASHPASVTSATHTTPAVRKNSAVSAKTVAPSNASGARHTRLDQPALPASACSLVSVAQMGQLTGLGQGMIDPNGGIGANTEQRACTYLFHGGAVDVILTGGTTAAAFSAQQAGAAGYNAVPMTAEVGVPAFATESQDGGTGVAALDGTIGVLVTSIAPVTATAVLHIAATVVGALG